MCRGEFYILPLYFNNSIKLKITFTGNDVSNIEVLSNHETYMGMIYDNNYLDYLIDLKDRNVNIRCFNIDDSTKDKEIIITDEIINPLKLLLNFFAITAASIAAPIGAFVIDLL